MRAGRIYPIHVCRRVSECIQEWCKRLLDPHECSNTFLQEKWAAWKTLSVSLAPNEATMSLHPHAGFVIWPLGTLHSSRWTYDLQTLQFGKLKTLLCCPYTEIKSTWYYANVVMLKIIAGNESNDAFVHSVPMHAPFLRWSAMFAFKSFMWLI